MAGRFDRLFLVVGLVLAVILPGILPVILIPDLFPFLPKLFLPNAFATAG